MKKNTTLDPVIKPVVVNDYHIIENALYTSDKKLTQSERLAIEIFHDLNKLAFEKK